MTALEFYDGPDLEGVVLDALRGAGRAIDPLDSDELAAMDEFHALARAGTLALVELAGVTAGDRVLNVCAGIGSPSRALTRHFGAEVTALDPTERFCRLAQALNERCGLADRITVVTGAGRSLPFEDRSFDLVWTQAVWQNIEDKATVSAEIHRVLRPGGRPTMLEVIRLGSDELHYAVPWPDGPAENFVASAEEATATLGGARFETLRRLVGEDVQSAIAAAACDRLMATGVPGIRLELLMLDYEARMGGLARNVETGLIGLALALFQAR